MKPLRRELERWIDEDRDLPPSAATFLRGLSLGALVGAAIAGTALVRRRARSGPPDPGADARDEERDVARHAARHEGVTTARPMP